MSICSDVDITRQKALERVFKNLMFRQEDLIRKAVNGMSNDELASELHSEMYYYHVSGKGKLKDRWELTDDN
jgi:hypothetical protein